VTDYGHQNILTVSTAMPRWLWLFNGASLLIQISRCKQTPGATMKYRTTTRLERPLHQAAAYLMHGLVFVALALLSEEPWIVLLCAFLFCISAVKAIQHFASAMTHRDGFAEKGFVPRASRSRG
jgi:hypothetical protein